MLTHFSAYRNCDTWRLRKVVCTVTHLGRLIDKTRMFACLPFFRYRLAKRKARMLRRAAIMIAESK